jgi:DNA-binding beta-propeller fold protein YncE
VNDSGSAATLFFGGTNPKGVAIDPAAGKIYWASGDGIQVGNLDGSGSPSTLFDEGGQGVAVDPAAGKIYWGNFSDVRVGKLDGSGSPSTLFAGVGAFYVAVQPGPAEPPAAPAAAAGEDPKCKQLRKKRKRQTKNLAAATTETKRSQIQANIKDTKKRLKRLACK